MPFFPQFYFCFINGNLRSLFPLYVKQFSCSVIPSSNSFVTLLFLFCSISQPLFCTTIRNVWGVLPKFAQFHFFSFLRKAYFSALYLSIGRAFTPSLLLYLFPGVMLTPLFYLSLPYVVILNQIMAFLI